MELKVRVHLLNDPVLWCWELVEPVSGRVCENSWTSEWQAYGSPAEAVRAATVRLGHGSYEGAGHAHAA